MSESFDQRLRRELGPLGGTPRPGFSARVLARLDQDPAEPGVLAIRLAPVSVLCLLLLVAWVVPRSGFQSSRDRALRTELAQLQADLAQIRQRALLDQSTIPLGRAGELEVYLDPTGAEIAW